LHGPVRAVLRFFAFQAAFFRPFQRPEGPEKANFLIFTGYIRDFR